MIAPAAVPKAPEVDFSSIPQSLTEYPHFVLWQYVDRDGKLAKMPRNTGGRFAKTNAQTHHTLAEVTAAYRRDRRTFSGIGTVLRGGLCGIDLDHVLDRETGAVEPWAQTILDAFAGSYIETSPGGDGFHILCRGAVGHAGKQGPSNRLETYDMTSPRYLTMTGHKWAGGALDITEQQAALDWLHETHGKASTSPKGKAAPAAPAKSNVIALAPPVGGKGVKSDEWIIAELSAKNPAQWEGQDSGDKSAEDQKLCNSIAYWNPSPVAVDAVFRQSGRMRDKWERKDYREATVNKAISGSSAQAGEVARANYAARATGRERVSAALIGGGGDVQQGDAPLINPVSIYHPSQMVFKDMPDGTLKFIRAKPTSENLGRLIAAYGVSVRYNQMSKLIEVLHSGSVHEGDLKNSTGITILEDICKLNGFPDKEVLKSIELLAEKNTYNPAKDWVLSKPWDGEQRLINLFQCMTLKDKEKEPISWKLFRKWFLGAAALLTGEANSFEFVLVLVDPHGGMGKTRFFRTFSPEGLHADGKILDLNSKDSVLGVVSRWLVELGELDGSLNKNQIAALKAFLGQKSDNIRPSYGRVALDYARRTAFFASVNDAKFLTDDSSNRRFWPIEVTAVDFMHTIDIQQAWAEAVAAVAAGETWYLSPEENKEIGIHNAGFRAMGAIEEAILAAYTTDAEEKLLHPPTRYLTASEVLKELGFERPGMAESKRAGAILKKSFECVRRDGLDKYKMPTKFNNSGISY